MSGKEDKTDTKLGTTAPSVSSASLKAGPVYTKEEIYRFIDLGLGRGLDGTDSTPWLNKTSFQVRRVEYDNIIGTEEGGALRSYEREITSVQTQQTQIKGSLLVPQSPLTIGTDAELSRSISTTRRAIGKKVVNRTISFRDEFDDVPSGGSSFVEAALHVSSVTVPLSINENLTFEERLAQWIVQRLHRKWEENKLKEIDQPLEQPSTKVQSPLRSGVNPIENLGDILQHGNKEDFKNIIRACKEFVKHFRITHFVSAIELGAAEYRVLTEEEYSIAVGVAGTFGIDKLANLVVSQESKWSRKTRASDIKSIGVITKNQYVERGSHDEAVVGVKIQPITNLVKMSFLHLALKKALISFVESQSDASDGPYILSCRNDTVYLAINPEDGSVVATEDIHRSSLFYIIPTDVVDQPYGFYIAHYSDDSSSHRGVRRRSTSLALKQTSLEPVARYINAPLSVLGRNSGPLFVQESVSKHDSRFVLHHRIVGKKGSTPVSLTSWTSGRDTFYINCVSRKLRTDGYFAVKNRQRRRDASGNYITACVRNIRHHDNHSTFLLFRLLPGIYKVNGFPEDDADNISQNTLSILENESFSVAPSDKPHPIIDSDTELRHEDTAKLLKDDGKLTSIGGEEIELHTK